MNLKGRLAAREAVDAVVVRTPSYQVIEVLVARGVDCVMIDTEHAPFDPSQLDAVLAVGHALGVDVLVRVPGKDRHAIQQALDGGAAGIVAPHVATPERVGEVVRWCRYGDGGRGYSGSTRSGGWGTRSLADVVAAAESFVVVVQIEDSEALDHLDFIVAADGVDAVFVGAADLTLSLGASSPSDPTVAAACERIIAAADRSGRSIVAYASDCDDAERWRRRGANVVLTGSDQSRLQRL